MYRIIFLVVLSNFILVNGVEITNCAGGSSIGKYTNVTISNCDSNSPDECILKRGTDATIGIIFTIDKDVAEVKAVVHGILQGIPVPFPISEPNACTAKTSGITCPLAKSGGPYHYAATLHVDEKYPKLRVTVKWQLKNEQNEEMVCVEIPSKIQ